MSGDSISRELRARLAAVLRRIGLAVVERVRRNLLEESRETLSRVAAETAGDTIYFIDRRVEDVIVPLLERELAPLASSLLIAEGLAEEGLVIPPGKRPEEAELRLILDPIDGTRGIMYDKRSAWFLAGVAPNRGEATSLEDIEVAVQVEIPTTRSGLSDTLWAARGEGVHAVTRHLDSGREVPFTPRPSAASTVRGGFAMLARMFPPGRDLLASLDDELMRRVLGDAAGRTIVFEDQFPSTGGQLYQLATGRDRFIADLRPLIFARLLAEGRPVGLSCHPYDLATLLIAREAGVILRGFPLPPFNVPLDAASPVAWAGYANQRLRDEVEPVLLALLKERGFLPH